MSLEAFSGFFSFFQRPSHLSYWQQHFWVCSCRKDINCYLLPCELTMHPIYQSPSSSLLHAHAHSVSASLCPISWGLTCTSPVKDKVSTVVHWCPWSSSNVADGWHVFLFSEELTTLSLHPWEGNNALSYLAPTQVILHWLFEFQCHVAQKFTGTEQYHCLLHQWKEMGILRIS